MFHFFNKKILEKLKFSIYFFSLLILIGCETTSRDKTEDNMHKSDVEDTVSPVTKKQDSLLSRKDTMDSYLFNAEDMDSIEISGEKLLSRKEVNMSVKLNKKKTADFYIAREAYGPAIDISVCIGSNGVDFASWYLNKALDEYCGALSGYYYQEVCYDFDKDGEKEIVIAAGNKKDKLYIYVFRLKYETTVDFLKSNPKLVACIVGGSYAYVNSNNEICVVDSKNQEITYPFNELEQIKSSSLATEKFKQDDIQILYPKIIEIDSVLSRRINKRIKKNALCILEKYYEKSDKYSLEIKFKYFLDSAKNILSIRYEGLVNTKETKDENLFYTTNIDLVTGNILNLSSVFDLNMDFVKELRENIVIQADNVRKNVALKNAIEKQWNKYDNLRLYADLINKPFKDSKVSFYLKKTSLGISFDINHTLGDHVEFEVPYSRLEKYILQY